MIVVFPVEVEGVKKTFEAFAYRYHEVPAVFLSSHEVGVQWHPEYVVDIGRELQLRVLVPYIPSPIVEVDEESKSNH